MGNVAIVIHVVGSHHNGEPSDIDAMSKVFVMALKANGHSVTHASIAILRGAEDITHLSAARSGPGPRPADLGED